MARCVSLQWASSCSLFQSIQSSETPDTRAGSVAPCQLVNSHLKLQCVGFSAPQNSRRRTSHVTNATRPTRRRQIRKTEETVVVEDDPPENWKPSDYDDGLPRPWLDEPDFFEGEQWNLLGTFVEWMPVIGVVFAALGAVVAVASYNGGAADYKETEEFQAAVQNQKEADELAAASLDAPSVADD